MIWMQLLAWNGWFLIRWLEKNYLILWHLHDEDQNLVGSFQSSIVPIDSILWLALSSIVDLIRLNDSNGKCRPLISVQFSSLRYFWQDLKCEFFFCINSNVDSSSVWTKWAVVVPNPLNFLDWIAFHSVLIVFYFCLLALFLFSLSSSRLSSLFLFSLPLVFFFHWNFLLQYLSIYLSINFLLPIVEFN